MVWLTGSEDLRLNDHGGFTCAAAVDGEGAVVPVFVLDPDVHLRYAPPRLAQLHTALSALESQLSEVHSLPLIIRRGNPQDVLPTCAAECGASTCHVIADDVEAPMRAAQRAGCAALEASGIAVRRWDGSLRVSPWNVVGGGNEAAAKLPCTFPEYSQAAGSQPLQAPLDAPEVLPFLIDPLPSEGLPSLETLLAEAAALAPPSALAAAARGAAASTAPPFEDTVRALCAEPAARAALAQYVAGGAAAFADATFTRVAAGSGAAAQQLPSLHCAGHQRLLDSGAPPSAVFALREAATRAFSPALAVGALSARQVRHAARGPAAPAAAPDDAQFWGRSSEGALADTVEWREWFTLLARRTLALQEMGAPATAGGDKARTGDPREAPAALAYWRWGGQHLVRYAKWEAGADYDGAAPALLLVHGFAASVEQWERLVHSLRQQSREASGSGSGGADILPPVYAVDLLGFGFSEKPGLTYTQYVWEAQVVDFVREVMEGRPTVLVGNSIGGGLSAGASATLGDLCQGVVLCNTAGVLEEPEDYGTPSDSVRDATLRREYASPYAPVPLLGQPALDLFGDAIIGGLYPRIPKLLEGIYSDRPSNSDEALAFAIQQGASSPGSANVIGSGQKLAANRPLNEVLNAQHGFGGPVLVAQGTNDKVSGPARAQERADVFERLRPGVTVRRIEGGHCPQDDTPEQVAEAILAWLPEATAYAASSRRGFEQVEA